MLLHQLSPDESTEIGRDPLAYPSSDEEWRDWYSYRWGAYLGQNYSVAVIKALQLFRAIDPDGHMVAQARRLNRDIQFVTDTGTGALVRGPITVEVSPGTPGEESLQADAGRIWVRSQVKRQLSRYARLLCSMGDLFLEAARGEDGRPRIVCYEAYNVTPVYDEAGIELVKATITQIFQDDSDVDVYGRIHKVGARDVLIRELTTTDVKVTLNGDLLEAVSGPHGLGSVPLVHVPCLPYTQPEHSLWVGHAMDRALAEVDSLMSQISAIGDRYADPHLVVQGAKLGEGTDVNRFGHILNITGLNADKAKAYYLEIQAAGLDSLLKAALAQLADVRSTMPEYLFVTAGAQASGRALALRMDQFVAKYTEIRGNFYGGLARVTGYAVAMERGQPFDLDLEPFTITGGPLLPVDVGAELDNLQKAADMGAITREDTIRRIQSLGLADNTITAQEYASRLDDEQADRAAGFFTGGEE